MDSCEIKKKNREREPLPRHGCSMNIWKNQLLIFGGELEFNQKNKKPECLNDVMYMDV